MANNNKDQLVQKDFPYPPAGNFKPDNYNQEVKAAILAAGMPKEGNANLASILRKQYGYLIDEEGNLQGRAGDINPETGDKYPFLVRDKQRVSMPLAEKVRKDYPQLPKWMGFFQDLDDFSIKILKFWQWNRNQKTKEKTKAALRLLRESKLNAPSANNNETRNFIPVPGSSTGATMASGSAPNPNTKQVSKFTSKEGILASRKLPDLNDLPKAKFPTSYPEGQEGDKVKLACENLPRQYRFCESLVEQTKSLTNQELVKFWEEKLIINESLSLKHLEPEAESILERYGPDTRGWNHVNRNAKKPSTTGNPDDDIQLLMHATSGKKRSATTDQPGKGKFVPKNREIQKDLSEEQKKLVLHIKPKREAVKQTFSEADWKNVCDTLFSAMMTKEDANQFGDVMVKEPKLDKKGHGFILCKDQTGLNWLLSLAKESLVSTECYQGNYKPRANLRVKLTGFHGGDPVNILKKSLGMSGIYCRYPDEIKISKITTISGNGRVADFNLNQKDIEEIGAYREVHQKNSLHLFAPIFFYIILSNGKEDNWVPKNQKTTTMAKALSAKDHENKNPIEEINNISLGDDDDDNNDNANTSIDLNILEHSEDEEVIEEDEDEEMKENDPSNPPKKTRSDPDRWAAEDPLKEDQGDRYVNSNLNHSSHNKNIAIPNKQAKSLSEFSAKERKRKRTTQEKEICLSFSRMAPKPPMMIPEQKFGTNLFSGPKIPTEFYRNQNGSGNSLKQQITYNATKSKDFNALNVNNSPKSQISFNTAESKDSNEINEKEHTKNNEKLSLESRMGRNLSSGPITGNEKQETAFERGFSQFLKNFIP